MENLTKVLNAGAKRCVIVSQLLTAADVIKATAEAKKVIALHSQRSSGS
jgi:thiamine monophosphate synthase